jgi:hypothetical protein
MRGRSPITDASPFHKNGRCEGGLRDSDAMLDSPSKRKQMPAPRQKGSRGR